MERLLRQEVSIPEAIVHMLGKPGIDMPFGIPNGNTLQIFHARNDWVF